ncbi:MAG: type II secretion system protein [Eubacterium sp.]|nr:type II secretion system protein [Eubacterium sp.]
MNNMIKIREKLKDNRAFTLAETLIAILILLMVTSVVAAGMPAAISAYQKVERASNAELLLSTTISTLRNELGVSKDQEVNSGNTAITYYNESNNMMSRIYMSDGKIMYKRNAGSDLSVEGEKEGQPLISDALRTKSKLEVTYDSVSINSKKTLVEFDGLKVKYGSELVTSRSKVYIRIIS